MDEAADFVAETEALAAVLAPLSPAGYATPTLFKGWTCDDVLVHLHFWNRAADLSLHDPGGFAALFAGVARAVAAGGLRALENAAVAERGPALLAAWTMFARDMGARWAKLDPKRRVRWAGPDMSVRSAVSARQMETWAHGQAVFDALGVARAEHDRIRNIVALGVNTFEWSFRVRGRTVPGPMPRLRLTAPSGAIWEFGEGGADLIEGPAAGFAQVVTQTRNVADTGLRVTGPVATEWMGCAQCFAGPPETPPAPGTRRRAG
jgi:uncharacterized protein (TIGR03084 family)